MSRHSSPRRPASTRERRPPLTRERVLLGAIDLADEAGLESLSMRRLGRELGVEAMSLYNHVASKDDLAAGMLELVLEEIEDAEGPDWKEGLRRSAVSAHATLVAHPWACSLMTRSTRISPARLRWMESVLRTLREAGFSAELTHHAYHALDSHVTGFTLWETSFPFQTREELVELADAFLPQVPVDRYPYVVEHARQHLGEPDPDEPPEFEFGLDLILDGLERMRDGL